MMRGALLGAALLCLGAAPAEEPFWVRSALPAGEPGLQAGGHKALPYTNHPDTSLVAVHSAEPFFLGEARPPAKIGRVISLAPSLTEILFALGLGDRVVGVTSYDDYPPQVKDITRVGGFVDPSLEGILVLRPDLVVCVPNSGGRDRMDALSRMGVPVLVLPSAKVEDLYRSILKLGEILGQTDQARKLAAGIQQRLEAVERRVEGKKRPRVLMVYGHNPLYAAGAGSFADDMLRAAGGENVLADSKVSYPMIPLEEIVRLAPEVIIDASSSGTGAEMTRAELIEVWDRWKVVPAVRDGRIFFFDSALWFRLGPRVADGIEKLSHILHQPN